MKWARLLEVAKRRAWSTTRKEAAERDGCLGLCRTRELEIASNTIVLEGGLGDTQSCMDRPNKGIAEAGAKPVERRGLLDSWICATKIAKLVEVEK